MVASCPLTRSLPVLGPNCAILESVKVHLVDGTYELFRHFYGGRRFRSTDPPYGAVIGVLGTVLELSLIHI